MNSLNYKFVLIAMITSIISFCIQQNAAFVKENKHIFGDAHLLPRSKHIRHVPALRKGIKLSPSITPPIIDLDLSKEAQPRSSESNNSAEIDFSEEDDVKVSSTSLPVPSTDQSVAVDNHSSVSLELEANSSEWKLLNVADFSESPPQNKIQRAIPAENVKETVVIDEGKDEAFDTGESEGSSKLWIYSNAVCILLVVGVSIFLIYYPKKDRRKPCNDSSESSSSSSSSSSTA